MKTYLEKKNLIAFFLVFDWLFETDVYLVICFPSHGDGLMSGSLNFLADAGYVKDNVIALKDKFSMCAGFR